MCLFGLFIENVGDFFRLPWQSGNTAGTGLLGRRVSTGASVTSEIHVERGNFLDAIYTIPLSLWRSESVSGPPIEVDYDSANNGAQARRANEENEKSIPWNDTFAASHTQNGAGCSGHRTHPDELE